jgi:nitroreductase
MNTHLEPWAIATENFPADNYASDQLEFLLGYAILAPSPHNTQPWRFRINVNDAELFADRRRALRVVDPRDRELTLACAAALYNLRVATEYFGRSYAVEILPRSDEPDLLACLTLRLHAETSSEDVLLFHAITQRRTNREAFRPDPLPDATLAELAAAAAREGAWLAIVTTDEARRAVADLVAKADRIQWADREFRRELAAWLRTDAEHQADGIPTHDLGVRDWMSFAGPAWVRTFKRGNHEAARDAEIATHSSALAVLGTDRDDPWAWLQAGQALENVLLQAQANGVSASYLNQPIEVDDLRPQLAGVVGRSGFPQVLLRLGYGPEAPPTPRRSVRSLLIRHDTSKGPQH